MTVVEEPAEGELVESVVVAVDVLVALRPAITIVTNLKGRKREKWKNSVIIIRRKMFQFSDRDKNKKYEIFCPPLLVLRPQFIRVNWVEVARVRLVPGEHNIRSDW